MGGKEALGKSKAMSSKPIKMTASFCVGGGGGGDAGGTSHTQHKRRLIFIHSFLTH